MGTFLRVEVPLTDQVLTCSRSRHQNPFPRCTAYAPDSMTSSSAVTGTVVVIDYRHRTLDRDQATVGTVWSNRGRLPGGAIIGFPGSDRGPFTGGCAAVITGILRAGS